MPKITFTGDPNPNATNPASLDHLGVTFPLGVPVDVPDDVAQKLATHSHFSVGGKKAEPPAVPPAAPPADVPFEAKHRGFGRYSVMQGDKEVVEGLSKEEAAAFNTWSDEDKAAYVAAGQRAA